MGRPPNFFVVKKTEIDNLYTGITVIFWHQMEHIPDDQSGIHYCFELHLAVSFIMWNCFSVTTVSVTPALQDKYTACPRAHLAGSALPVHSIYRLEQKLQTALYFKETLQFALIAWPVRFSWLGFAKKVSGGEERRISHLELNVVIQFSLLPVLGIPK